MFWFLFFLSCMITVEGEADKLAVTLETGETTKAISVRSPLKSSAKVVIFNEDEFLGHGSGNYFKSGKYKFVLTAAHVLKHKFSSFILDGEELVKLKTIYINNQRDIAIAVPEKELENIKATKFRVNRDVDLVGKTIYYAGFPKDMEKSLFRGFVSRSTSEWIMIQSFALPGSSGAVVFDFWGRAIGLISAVKLGVFGFSPYPELVETAVVVQKFDFIDHDFIRELFENENDPL